MPINRLFAPACAAMLCLMWAPGVRASLIVADFNDNTLGQLAGQAGGAGLSGNWAGATNPQVVTGDLSAPVATHYATPQSAGIAQSVQTTNTTSTSATGQDARGAAATLTGTVWFSFLVNPIDANARAGISFNISGPAASGARLDTVGTGLFLSYGASQTVPNAFTTGSAHLVVGEVIINEGGGANTNDHLRVWVDPDVTTLTESTTTGRVFDAATADWVANGITSLAVQSYGIGTTQGGIVDAVRASDGPNAAGDVGVPEPAGVGMLVLGCIAVFTRRRR
jgi:hypothetical protein